MAMDYHLLTDAQLTEIRRQKLMDLEIAHAQLTLDARLAEAAGVPADQIAPTWRDIAVVTAQADALVDLMRAPALPQRKADA